MGCPSDMTSVSADANRPQGLVDAHRCLGSVEILCSIFHHFKNIKSLSSCLPIPPVALGIWCPTSAFLQLMLLIAHFCFLLQRSAEVVCSHTRAQWVALQMLKCPQRKKKLSINEGERLIFSMLFLYLGACKVCNF